MSNQTAKYIKLSRCVEMYMSQANLTNAHYVRLWHMAFTCFSDLNMDYTGTPITRKLNVNPNKTVDLPGDYIQYSKVGVLNENGEVVTLKLNSNMTAYGSPYSDRLSVNRDNSNNVGPDVLKWSYFNYFDGEQYLTLLVLPSGTTTYGHFKIDEQNGVILLDADFSYDYVLLEYLSSPESNEDYLVPVQFQSAIIAFLRWQDIVSMPSSRRSNIGEKQYRQDVYYRELRKAKVRFNPVRLWEANDVIRLGTKLAPKA